MELAEAIVHMVYNYVVEDSIEGIAKHYDESKGMGELLQDFAHRIQIYWSEHADEGLHDIHKPGNGAEGAGLVQQAVWHPVVKIQTKQG